MEGFISTALKPVKIFVFDVIGEYVGYVGSCEDNLCKLRKNLSVLCDKKDDLNKKVEEGKKKSEEITRQAASWLKDVRILAGDEELISLMYKDIETAKCVVRLMGKKDLKKLMRKDGEMQKLTVKVMNRLKEEMEKCEDEMKEIAKLDYKMAAEVVVEVMKDTTEEFKMLMKKDKKMAVMATKMLKDRDLEKLTKDDKEMEEIVREAGSVSDEELFRYDVNEDDAASQALLVKVPEVAEDKSTVREAATKLLTPLGNLLTRLGKLMDDANFKDAVPEAESVKLGLDVINGLLLKDGGFKKGMDDNIGQHRICRCRVPYFNYSYNRYKLSKSAKTMAKRIESDVIETYPDQPVTVPKWLIDMERIPSQYLKGLQSRDKLLQEILQILKDDQVDAVGLYGMGGCGKTTLAKEVGCKCVDMFSIIMVEITKSPDIKQIQGTIANSIRLSLHDEHDIAQRATKLLNRLNKENKKKFLIILDNIWEKINLVNIGIPRTCKLLLTTREKDVCRLMGVSEANSRPVGLLDATEGKRLLCSQAGEKVGSKEYKTVIDRLLSKCGGLPLAIVVTANALKDKDLPEWRKFADELEKPLSFQLPSADHDATYSILSTSYNNMKSKEKRMFFLLCCLWCFDSQIPIKAVTRCGIGLDLFQHVNKLSEAMDQADRWADELMSSSMLLKSYIPGYLKIHDVVRDFGILFAAKDDGHKFLVDAIPRWMNKKTLTEYTAISLLSNNDYSRLTEMDSNELQILLLESKVMPNNPSSFFATMTNLIVLSLKNMNLLPKLPESLGKLVKLRTLSLEGCQLEDIKVIGELVNLYVLSFRESHMVELPNEIGNLINLRVLDLTKCICNFRSDRTNILGGLSKLEGLFMIDIFGSRLESNEGGGTSDEPVVIDFNNLHYLNALEMRTWRAEQLSVDAQFVKNLDNFTIWVTHKPNHDLAPLQVGSFLRILDVDGVDVGEWLGEKTFKALLKKADWLRLNQTRNLSHLFPELDNEGFIDLRHLEVRECEDVKFIVNGVQEHQVLFNPGIVFSALEEFTLDRCNRILKLWDKELGSSSFQSLRTINIYGCEQLSSVGPLSLFSTLVQLESLTIDDCKSMHEVITTEGTQELEERDQVLIFPQLKELYIGNSSNLKSFYGGRCKLKFPNLKILRLNMLECLNKFAGSENQSVLFHKEIVFSALEEINLCTCNRILKLWDKELGISSFQSLREIYIYGCEQLSSVGPLSLFSTLKQLESLTIDECKSVHEVITTEGTEELEKRDQVVIFPQLKYLDITNSSNLKSFYGGTCKLKFPNLQTQSFAAGRA